MFHENPQPLPIKLIQVELEDELAHADAHAYLDPFHPNYGAEILRNAAMRDQLSACPLRRVLYARGAPGQQKFQRSWFIR